MSERYLAVGVLVVVVLIGGIGVVTQTDIGTESGFVPIVDDDITELPISEEDDTTERQPFTLTIAEIEDCGRTCRDVTATIENTQDEPATGVSVSTTIYAGKNTTREGDQLWERTREIGTLDADDSRTVTEQVSLSLSEGLAVRRNDGWITIETTVDSDEETVTMRRTRDVS